MVTGTRKRTAKTNGALAVEQVPLDSLKAHPRNYRSHPDAQLQHLRASIEQFGVYRNVVVANDGTILAGHGVVEAARATGAETIPVVRMGFGPDSPKALKLIAADNEVSHLAEDDESVLAGLLEELGKVGDLLGTGFDDLALQVLLSEVNPPDFEPVSEDEQGRLDQKSPVTCPECGTEFVPK